MNAPPNNAQAPVTPVAGSWLAGKYRVERVLGEGGMGVVVLATNVALRQRVAIKLLRSGSVVNARARARFEREARAAASLRSEHVARVLDVGTLNDGSPYMVMEYLEGCDLGDEIDKGVPRPVGELVDFILQACEAVAEAHAAGIIHRDLKPRNLFLANTVDGRTCVKVLDFGISKRIGAEDDLALTRTTDVIGSPSYMSPEQLRASRDVDSRTDIWALGIILYELLSKKVPFQASTLTELVAVVLMDATPDVRIERPDVPDGIVAAIHKCLEKRREDRFASVAELVTALAPFGTRAATSVAARTLRIAQASSRVLDANTVSTDGALNAPEQTTSDFSPTVSTERSAPWPVPAAPVSSARIAVPGRTGVPWDKTHDDTPIESRAEPARRWLVAAVLAAIVALAGSGVSLAYYIKKNVRRSVVPAVAASATSAPAVLPAPAPAPSSRASAPDFVLPSARPAPHDARDARERGPRTPVPARSNPKATPDSSDVTPAPDDLSNIGRR
jgi:serine/threonine-protein kinase